MDIALNEAKKAEQINEIPVGAVLVLGDNIISYGMNRTIIDNDPTSHAEINAIRKASKKSNNHRLIDTTLFVTLEPCAMCYGAIVQARVSRVVFGAYDLKTGACGTCMDLKSNQCFNHTPEIIGGVMREECSKLLSDFFKNKRN